MTNEVTTQVTHHTLEPSLHIMSFPGRIIQKQLTYPLALLSEAASLDKPFSSILQSICISPYFFAECTTGCKPVGLTSTHKFVHWVSNKSQLSNRIYPTTRTR